MYLLLWATALCALCCWCVPGILPECVPGLCAPNVCLVLCIVLERGCLVLCFGMCVWCVLLALCAVSGPGVSVRHAPERVSACCWWVGPACLAAVCLTAQSVCLCWFLLLFVHQCMLGMCVHTCVPGVWTYRCVAVFCAQCVCLTRVPSLLFLLLAPCDVPCVCPCVLSARVLVSVPDVCPVAPLCGFVPGTPELLELSLAAGISVQEPCHHPLLRAGQGHVLALFP